MEINGVQNWVDMVLMNLDECCLAVSEAPKAHSRIETPAGRFHRKRHMLSRQELRGKTAWRMASTYAEAEHHNEAKTSL